MTKNVSITKKVSVTKTITKDKCSKCLIFLDATLEQKKNMIAKDYCPKASCVGCEPIYN